jgi:putative membrane protein
MTVADLPALNATLNGLATLFLVAGWLCIRARRIAWHRASMLAAFTTSAAFLVSYLVYHYHVGSKPFGGAGAIRLVYFLILITHIILAAAIVPLSLLTLSRALARRFDKHRRIARITLPIWLYVSVTGVVVYVMLYQM